MRRTWIAVAQRAEVGIWVRDAHRRQPMLQSEIGGTKTSPEPDVVVSRRTTHTDVFNLARKLRRFATMRVVATPTTWRSSPNQTLSNCFAACFAATRSLRSRP